jgi:hypothetical protein
MISFSPLRAFERGSASTTFRTLNRLAQGHFSGIERRADPTEVRVDTYEDLIIAGVASLWRLRLLRSETNWLVLWRGGGWRRDDNGASANSDL